MSQARTLFHRTGRTARANAPHRHGLVGAARYFDQRHRHLELDVRSRAGTGSTSTASAEQIAESTEPAEVAHENVQRLGEVDVVEPRRAAPQSRLAVAIVERALVGIAQNVVRLGDGLELLLGFLRAVVAIGMVGHRQLAIRNLYFCIAGGARDAKRVVIISHVSWNSPTVSPSAARTYASRAR